MFGCIRRLGCLVVVLAVAAGGYYWWTVKRPAAGPAAGVWQAVTQADATSAEASVQRLKTSRTSGGTTLTPAQAVAYLIQETARQLPPSSTNVQAMILGDQLHVRAVVPLRELGAERALGPLASMIGARDTVELAGTVDVLRAGMAQMHVVKAQIHDFALPRAVLPKLVQQIRHDAPEGIAADAFPIPLPGYIAGVRIADGKVTLYKNVN